MTEDEGAEPKRAEPGFRILVQPLDDTSHFIDVTFAVMDVYDIAVGSMDFGSGFLSTEEVGNLRVLGKAIGAERFDYQHDKCFRCGHEKQNHYELVVQTIKCIHTECSCEGFVSPH